MIWINTGNASYLAIACNTSKKGDKDALWIQRMDNTNIKVFEGTEGEVKELKEALDFAVENGILTFKVK